MKKKLYFYDFIVKDMEISQNFTINYIYILKKSSFKNVEKYNSY